MALEAAPFLWALAGVVLVLIFSFLRLNPRPVPVPDLMVWKTIPLRPPPLQEARRPKLRLSAILQALAYAAGVLALAKPLLNRHLPASRNGIVVLDTSPRMLVRHPDGETSFEKALKEIRRLASEHAPSDRIVVLAWQQELCRIETDAAHPEVPVSAGYVTGDLRDLIARGHEQVAGRPDSKLFVISDRPPEVPSETVVVLVGSPHPRNVGIAGARIEEGTLFVRFAGTPGRITLTSGESLEIPAGGLGRSFPIVSEVRILEEDDLAEDNVLRLQPVSLTATVEGRAEPSLRRALAGLGVRIVPEASIRILVGVPVPPNTPFVFSTLPSVDAFAVSALTFAEHRLLAGADLAAIRPTLACAVPRGVPIIRSGDRAIASVEETPETFRVWLGFDPFQASLQELASWLPVMLYNFFEIVREKQGPALVRAGEWFSLSSDPGRREGVQVVRGAEGGFAVRLCRVGEHRLAGRTIYANVLSDEVCEASGRWSVPERYAPHLPAGTTFSPLPLDTPLIVACLLLVCASWLAIRWGA